MMKLTRWIALIVSSASLFVTPSVLSDSELNPRLSLIAQAGNDAGISADLMYPLLEQSVTSLLYTDLELLGTGSHNAQAASLGLGYRHLLDSDDYILGGYAYFDRSRSQHKYNYNQVNLGAEALSNGWDFRGNLYWPLSNKETIVLLEPLTPYYPQGHKMLQLRDSIKEKAAKGFDIEAGMLIPDTNALRAYLGVYHYFFDHDETTITGPRLRAEYRYSNNWTFTASEQWDKMWGNKLLLGARYSIGGVDNHLTGNLEERMLDYVIRNRQVAVVFDRDYRRIWSSPENFYYANSASSSSSGGGDGTYEHPYSNPTTAVIQAENDASSDANNATDTVYIYTGNSGSTPYALNVLNIGNRQVFTGSTNDLLYHNQVVIAGNGTTPTLFGELTVSNSSNVEMRNFNLTGIGANTSTGILVSNANNVYIHDADIGNIVGANGTAGTPLTSGFLKGISYISSSADGSDGTSVVGINVSQSNNVTLSNLTIHDITGGNGGAGVTNIAIIDGGTGGSGGDATGLLVSNSTRLNWNNLAINTITGGKGSVGGDGTTGSSGLDASNAGDAGDGGAAYGVVYAGSSNLTWSNLTLNTITGGTGGKGGRGGNGANGNAIYVDGTDGGAGGSGGVGGDASGFLFSSVDNITGGTLSIDTIIGGNGGIGGAGGVGGGGYNNNNGNGGSGGNGGDGGNMSRDSGNAYGIQMISISNAPSSIGTRLNGDISITNIAAGNLAITGNGGVGGNGGSSLYNTTAGNGGNGGIGGTYSGGQAGNAFGMAIVNSQIELNNNITINNLTGGQGAAGGNGGNGGGSTGTGNFKGNDGNGANGGNGGIAGNVYGLEIVGSSVTDNGSSIVTISSLRGGSGGNGGSGSNAGNSNNGATAGSGGMGGSGGSAFGILLADSNLTLSELKVGATGTLTGGQAGNGGNGGNGNGGTDGNGGDGGFGGSATAYDQSVNDTGAVAVTVVDIMGSLVAGNGGNSGDGNFGGIGGTGGNAAGMNISGSEAAIFSNITLNVINITAGNGGNGRSGTEGGNGGNATGINASNSNSITINNLTLSGEITAGNGGLGGTNSSGGDGGDAVGIISSDANLSIGSFTLNGSITGGNGGGGNNGPGGIGGDAVAMTANNGNNININSLIVNSKIAAGKGGNGGTTNGYGGAGGEAAGMLVKLGNHLSITNLTFGGDIVAGNGGMGGNPSGNGGAGGTALGINLTGLTIQEANAAFTNITLNAINIMGGNGGNGASSSGHGGYGGDAWDLIPVGLSITITDSSILAGGNGGSGGSSNGASGIAYDVY